MTQRMRFQHNGGGRRAFTIEKAPSGRLQFRGGAPEAGPAAAQPSAMTQGELPLRAPVARPVEETPFEPFADDVAAYVQRNLAQAMAPGEAAASLDFDALEDEFEAFGQLSEESYALLQAAGIPRQIVDRYIEGQQAAADKLVKEAEEIAGGPQRLRAAQMWAETALPKAQLDAYQRSIEQGPEEAKFAVQALCAAHQRATGEAPRLTRGDAAAPSGGAFSSAAEVSEAIRDPRYKKDPAYRAQVAARLSKSKIF
ncbi:MAG: hypothetical protein AAGM38_15275 [Pseudomonadota bacterium]